MVDYRGVVCVSTVSNSTGLNLSLRYFKHSR